MFDVKEAIDEIRKLTLGAEPAKLITLHESPVEKHVLVSQGGRSVAVRVPKARPERQHVLLSLDSFLEWVKAEVASPAAKNAGDGSIPVATELQSAEAAAPVDGVKGAEAALYREVSALAAGMKQKLEDGSFSLGISPLLVEATGCPVGNCRQVVMCGEGAIVADVAYGSHEVQRATLALEAAEGWKAMVALCSKTWAQKGLWRLLITDLVDYMPPTLMMSISGLSVVANQSTQVKIDPSGMTDSSAASAMQLTFAGSDGKTDTAVIKLDWEYQGPVWAGVDVAVKQRLRLELVEVEGRIGFVFHAIGMKETLIAAREQLVTQVQRGVPEGVEVYQGAL